MTNAKNLLWKAVNTGECISYADCVAAGMDPEIPFKDDFVENFLKFLNEDVKVTTATRRVAHD